MSSPTLSSTGSGGQNQSTTGAPHDIFKDADIDELRLHIWILTIALRGYELDNPRYSLLWGNPKHDGASVRRTYRTLRHISTLLAVGSSEDRAAAVAGIVAPDRIVTLVATENTRPHRPPMSSGTGQIPAHQPQSITTIDVGGVDRALSLLRDYKTDITNIGFDEHLRDVATIVALFLQPPNTIDLKLCQTLFCMFMVRRGFRKLSARLQKMCTIWGDSGPIAVMQEWFKERGSVHDIPEHVVEFDGMRSSNGKVRELRDRLARHGVPHIGPCVVTSSNVPGWLATVSAILKELRTLLPMGRQVPPSFEEVPRIYKELGVLDTFLRSSFFKALEHLGVGPALGSKLRERYDKYQGTHMQKWRQEWVQLCDQVIPSQGSHPDTNLLVEEEDTQDTDVLQGDNDLFDQEPGEQPLNHVHRYLQTITAWVNVCRELSKSLSKQGVPLHLYQLNSQFSINITQKKSLDLKDQYAKVLTTAHQHNQTYQIALAAITRAISCAGSAKYLPHIHAEAAIMALAYASLEGKDADIPGLQDASVIFSTADISIGVSKKCCAHCDLFASYLKQSPPQGKPLKFFLPGTHGTIHPWMAPPYGVPRVVLEQMCQALFTALLVFSRALNRGLTSTKTSPASGSIDLEEVDYDEEALRASFVMDV
ncbi:hypothetical protein C2E23DRAFT_803460 [Lenzites betulinus]|nr:hypothetical protein C2E23DRAFT_803460 [Lenzites betulinus]